MESGHFIQESHNYPEVSLKPMDFLLDQTKRINPYLLESSWMREYAKLAQTQSDEFAFALVYFTNGTSQGIPLARWNNGSIQVPDIASFWIDQTQLQKVVYFHTHPLFSESTEIRDIAGGEIVTRVAPPSSDDFRMMVSRQKEKLPFQTEERIAGPMGIWIYGLKEGVTAASKEEEMYKLGTLFMSLSSITHEIDRRLQMLKLNKIQPGWWEVADTYDRLMNFTEITKNQAVYTEVLTAVKAFEIAMDRIGYLVRFEPYP